MGAPILLKELPDVAESFPIRSELSLQLFTEFGGPEAGWRRLEADASGHVFQTWLWASTWFNNVGAKRGIQPRIVVISSAGRIEALLPFGVRTSLGGTVLEWIGGEHADYHCGLFSPRFLATTTADEFQSLWRRVLALLRPVDAIHLVRQPTQLGEHGNPFLAIAHRPAPTGAYHTRLGAEFESYYESKRSGRSRHTDRAKQRKLVAAGEIRFAIADSAAEIIRVVDTMLEQKAGRLQEMGAANPFSRPGVGDYLKRYAIDAGRDGAIVAHLDCAGEIVACAYCLRRGGHVYYYIHSMTLGPLSRQSPGKLLMYDLMRWAIGEGIRIFDFTVGDEDYKNDWCEGRIELFENVGALSWRGAASASLSAATSSAKRMIKSVPVLKRAAFAVRSRLFGSGKHRG